MTEDTYTISVVRQDYANHFGAPPTDEPQLLLSYLAHRAAIRARFEIVRPDYVNSDAKLEALLQRIAA